MLNRRKFVGAATASLAVPSVSFASSTTNVITPSDLLTDRLSISELARELNGERVTMSGYMTPPIKGAENLAVLSEKPTRICPVCNDRTGDSFMAVCGPCSVGDASVSGRALAVYANEAIRSRPFNVRLEVHGILNVGTAFEERTGFMSSSQLLDAEYKIAKLGSF